MDLNKPRRGSRAYRPRKRAETQVPEMFWPACTDARVIGFAAYKAGMTTIAYIDQSESPTKGQEVVGAATVLEAPPLFVYGIRGYKRKSITSEIYADNEAKLKLLGIKKTKKSEVKEDVDDIRLLVFAQPSKTLIGKKHPERFELALGGKDAKEKLEFAKNLLGKELKAKDVFKSGEIIDVIAITKGKGWQGPVKRFGINKQRPKSTGKRRHVGTLGQWHPAYVLYTVPQGGQHGYHKRTELNKQILKISESQDEINPNGGFPHYGFVKNDFILVKGSVPGPTKRLVKLRIAVRNNAPIKEAKVTFVSNEPKQ
ncbi:50S ribosomal protein L3 [Candidatus Micrarchaeota archaeon]|nr:50S ribosomal protein L3 [Candidatus Micrarchaeota archaeon]